MPDGPCPTCAYDAVSTRNTEDPSPFQVTAFRTKSLVPGTRRWTYMYAAYHSVFRETGEAHFVSRTINRTADSYHERVIDKETGRVVREVAEPLSRHVGRGSAKVPRSSSPGAP